MGKTAPFEKHRQHEVLFSLSGYTIWSVEISKSSWIIQGDVPGGGVFSGLAGV
jgi:hypothetical protein